MNNQIRFTLPGLSRHVKLNIVFSTYFRSNRNKFIDGAVIDSIYGAFSPSLWNSGRNSFGEVEERVVRLIVSNFNNMNIGVRFTFSNPLITEKHLDDPFCNRCLEIISENKINGVIVVSEILENYIREKYPEMYIISSTCKCITDTETLKAELEKDYKLVVLDYNFNDRLSELESFVNKDKIELLINSGCGERCEFRREHYEFLGREQIRYNENRKFNLWERPCSHTQNPFSACKRTTFITRDKLWNDLVPAGYTNFKIEGRANSVFTVLEYYLYYLAKDEFKDEARFDIMNQLGMVGVVKVEE
ncbi:MAG: hypothetical protein LBL93_05460 [Ruminococcus sp.]|jgi:collagenase-like PrtC family protease|nr:hypothetical protein [Ruminococcus sp.]